MTQQQSDINERQPNGERPADARAAVKKYDRRSLTSAENGRRAWANHLRSEIQHIAETTEDQRLRFEALKYLYDRAEGKPYVMTNPAESKPRRVTDNRIQLAIGTLIHGDSAMNTKAAIEQSSKPQPQLLPEPQPSEAQADHVTADMRERSRVHSVNSFQNPSDKCPAGDVTGEQRVAEDSPTDMQNPAMRRMLAIAGSAIFLVIAPGIVAGYVPWRISRWHVGAPLLGTSSLRLVGVLLIAAGLPVLLDSFVRFALQGLGTPAPIFPTRHLVVGGLFRYVRNPMYVSVVSLILGQGLFFGNVLVLEYGIAVWVGFYLFVLIYEEPTLRKSYGPEYEEFCANVPRWIPRLRPWQRKRQ